MASLARSPCNSAATARTDTTCAIRPSEIRRRGGSGGGADDPRRRRRPQRAHSPPTADRRRALRHRAGRAPGLGAPRLVDLARFSFSRSSFRRSFSAFRWRSRLAASSACLLRAGALVERGERQAAISGADADGCSERARPSLTGERGVDLHAATPERPSSPRTPLSAQ